MNFGLAPGTEHKESDINDIKKNLRDVHDKTLKSMTVNLIREIMQQRNAEASQDLVDLGRQRITKKRVMKLQDKYAEIGVELRFRKATDYWTKVLREIRTGKVHQRKTARRVRY